MFTLSKLEVCGADVDDVVRGGHIGETSLLTNPEPLDAPQDVLDASQGKEGDDADGLLQLSD